VTVDKPLATNRGVPRIVVFSIRRRDGVCDECGTELLGEMHERPEERLGLGGVDAGDLEDHRDIEADDAAAFAALCLALGR